jgi:exonuclease SbcD
MTIPPEPAALPIRLLHTSDIHLGNDYAPQLAERALLAVMETARTLAADALLIAGDLFDHNRVSDAVVESALREFARFGRPIVLLPGNHDCLGEHSVYRRPQFAAAPPNLHLITDERNPSVVLPALGVECWGRPVVDHHPGFRPLASPPPRVSSPWRVVLAHGHVEGAAKPSFRSSPIWSEEIAALDCDYLALGHWDRPAEVSAGGVIAPYSGAPYQGGQLTTALLVALGPGQEVRVSAVSLHSSSACCQTRILTGPPSLS